MGIFKKIGSLLSETPLGLLAERAVDRVLPERLSEAEKAALARAIEQEAHARDMQLLEAANEQEKEFNDRIKSMEGTAGDLKTIPFIGSIVIFLRGVQRPLWGYAALWMDANWFLGTFGDLSDQQQTALIVINVLVLGFLFGERSLKNLTPLIVQMFGRKAGSDG